MKHSMKYYYRKIHRYFGVIIGIQFLFWTLSGLFFTWSNIDQIHGDFNRRHVKSIDNLKKWKSPSIVFEHLSNKSTVDSIKSFKTINFLGVPFYQISYFSNSNLKNVLVNVITGDIKDFISKEEAIQLAQEAFTPESHILNVEYITDNSVNNHHEYRGRPLPAYAVTFHHKSGTTVYVGAEFGQVVTFRNSNWRIFDFLWMMHTMDYHGRDNIGNVLLRIFSILGLITVISGFILYYISNRKFKIKKVMKT